MSVAGAYTDLPPANLTGPCLITYCVGSTVNPPNKNCQLSINTCTAQSRNFTDFFADPTNSSSTKNIERCSYNFVIQIAAEYGYCNIQELNGTVGGSGQTWSLFDAVSTLQLQYRGDVSTSPILSVESSTLSDFQHFFTGAAAAATTTGAGGGSVTIPTTIGTATSTSFQTTETAAGTVTRTTSNLASGSPTTCSSDYMCGSLLVGMSITSGSLVATSTTTTTGKATGTKNGSKGISSDGRSLSANVLLGLGAFTILCTIITW